MEDLLASARELLTGARAVSVVTGLLVLVVGLLLARMAAALAGRLAGLRFSGGGSVLVRKGVWYAGAALGVLAGARQAGIDVSVLLGAAGVLTVAVGFAAQTAASNIISGLFLVGERPFVLGDFIRVGGFVGEVVTVDLLSVRLRTPDNLLVRVPNDQLLKSEITTLTHFPIRRVEVAVGVAYGADLKRAAQALIETGERNTRVLDEPAPVAFVTGFGDSSIQMQLLAWVARDNFRDVKSELHAEVAVALPAAGIQIPFPHRTLDAAGPIAVEIVAPGGGSPA